jgi:hypothetical protein
MFEPQSLEEDRNVDANVDLQILYAYEDEAGEDVVASLDFWNKPR